MKKAEGTRLMILQNAFEMIYVKGYQTTSVDDIIAASDLTKGAFYYHFKTKDEMGFAIIDEILKVTLIKSFLEPLRKEKNPLVAIYNMMRYLLLEDNFLKCQYGCPVVNFTLEMTHLNLQFKEALDGLTNDLTNVMIEILEKGKENEFIRKNINTKQVTLLIISGYWGVRNFGKIKNNKEIYETYLKEFKNYLNTLQ